MTDEDPALDRTKLLFRVAAVGLVLAWLVASRGVAWAWAAGLLALGGLVLGVVVLVRVARFRQPRLLSVGAVSGMAVGFILVLYAAAAIVFAPQVAAYEECARHAITDTAKGQCQAELQDAILGG
ncbi:hypothetical protein [Sinomonas mesophila]|uniref:hypothetical protein n=1 Tax=Sinomonas mesophila TaxID=1531955 RepID=UPI0009840B3D|nr:hypothetical protein [Sinomonas mesophila]